MLTTAYTTKVSIKSNILTTKRFDAKFMIRQWFLPSEGSWSSALCEASTETTRAPRLSNSELTAFPIPLAAPEIDNGLVLLSYQSTLSLLCLKVTLAYWLRHSSHNKSD